MAAGWEDSFIFRSTVIFLCYEKHLSGIFYRNIALLEQGIKLVYVFDGIPPKQKYGTHKERQEGRELASQRYQEQEKCYFLQRSYFHHARGS